jgi:hypothetical protein
MILVVLLVLPTFASAQSLADAARKERERQKQLKSVVVVNQGVTTTTAAGTSGTAAAPPKQPAVKPFEVKDNNGRDEKYWRERFQKARDDAKRADDRVQLLDAKLRELNTALLTRSDIYNREYRLTPEIQDTQKQLDDARKTAEDARQKISDLEDELHKAGGPPGWAR